MLDKQAIREIPVSPETPRFYSPIFLVAKESGGWRPILNLKAFNKFVVAVAPEYTRYLRFAYNGRAFEFLGLPFGLSTAPRVFTRIVRVIEAFPKVQGVDMHQYLDDWLMKSLTLDLLNMFCSRAKGGFSGLPN